MADYLSVILIVSLFSAIINALLYEKGASKATRSVISIVMLFSVVLPIIKTFSFFEDNVSIPVINDSASHINVSKDDNLIYREWLADATAEEISEEISKSIKKYANIDARVECPWHLEEEGVVFDVIKVYVSCDERYYEKIKRIIKLHYQLDSECIRE